MAELFSVILQYFEIFDYGRKLRSYTIRFNDGNIKTIHKGMVVYLLMEQVTDRGKLLREVLREIQKIYRI